MMENIPEELLSAEHGGFVNFGITEVSNLEGCFPKALPEFFLEVLEDQELSVA